LTLLAQTSPESFQVVKNLFVEEDCLLFREFIFSIEDDGINVESQLCYYIRTSKGHESGWADQDSQSRKSESWIFDYPVVEEFVEDMFIFYNHFDALSFYWPSNVAAKFGTLLKPSFVSIVPKSKAKFDININQICLAEIDSVILRKKEARIGDSVYRSNIFSSEKMIGVFNIWIEVLRSRRIISTIESSETINLDRLISKNTFKWNLDVLAPGSVRGAGQEWLALTELMDIDVPGFYVEKEKIVIKKSLPNVTVQKSKPGEIKIEFVKKNDPIFY
jgi:hypothetical protein